MADPTEAEQESEDQAPARNWRRELEDRAKAAESERDGLRQKLAFSEAGLTGLSDKQVRALLAAHDGEIEAASIRQTATDLGFDAFTKSESKESEVDPEQAAAEQEAAEVAKFTSQPESSSGQMSAADVEAKIASFTNQDELEHFVLANPELFGVENVS